MRRLGLQEGARLKVLGRGGPRLGMRASGVLRGSLHLPVWEEEQPQPGGGRLLEDSVQPRCKVLIPALVTSSVIRKEVTARQCRTPAIKRGL